MNDTPKPPAMPSLWWSPSWGVLTEYTIGAGTFYDHTKAALEALRELPADAARLVPDTVSHQARILAHEACEHERKAWRRGYEEGRADPERVAELRAALQRVVDVLDFADGAGDPPITTEIDTNIVRMALLDTEDAPPAELRRQIRALLGTDTTPEAPR